MENYVQWYMPTDISHYKIMIEKYVTYTRNPSKVYS